MERKTLEQFQDEAARKHQYTNLAHAKQGETALEGDSRQLLKIYLDALHAYHDQEISLYKGEIDQLKYSKRWINVKLLPLPLYNTDLIVSDGHRVSIGDYNSQRGWGLQTNLYFEPLYYKDPHVLLAKKDPTE